MRAFLILLLLLAAPQRSGSAEESGSVMVAAASDLVFCVQELSAAFEKGHPAVRLKVTTGASGSLFAQIQRGAPFDVFMAADLDYPRKLAWEGAAEKTSLITYAIGHLVLWTLNPDVDVRLGLEVLRGAGVKRFAIANPAHAPYGRAAQAALVKAGLWRELETKMVLGENIAQTAQFVQTGHVDAGIVALSVVLSPKVSGQGAYLPIPETIHPGLEQGAVLTNRGGENQNARLFLQFLQTRKAGVIFERYGFRLPPRAVP